MYINDDLKKICHSCLCENNCAYIRMGLIYKCKDIINYMNKNKHSNKEETIKNENIYNWDSDKW